MTLPRDPNTRPLSFLTNAWGKLFKESIPKRPAQPTQNLPFMEGLQFHPRPAPGLTRLHENDQQRRATPRPHSAHPAQHRPPIHQSRPREGHLRPAFEPWQAPAAPPPPSSVSSDATPRPTTPPASNRASATPVLTSEEYAHMMVGLFAADNGPVTKEQYRDLFRQYKDDLDRLKREERRRTAILEQMRLSAEQQEARAAKGNWSTCPTAAPSQSGASNHQQDRRAARVWEYLVDKEFRDMPREDDAAPAQPKDSEQQEAPPATVPPVPPNTPFRDSVCRIPVFFDGGLSRTTFDLPTAQCPSCNPPNVEALNNPTPTPLLNSQRHPDSGALILYCPDSEPPRTALSIYLATLRNDRDPLAGHSITSTNWHLVLAYLVFIAAQDPTATPTQTQQASQFAHGWADSILPTDAAAIAGLGPPVVAALLYTTAQAKMPLHWASVARAALLHCRADADASLVDTTPSPRPLWLHLPADDVLREAVRELCRVLRTPRQECMGLTCAEVLETRRVLRRRAREGSESAREQREALRGQLLDLGLWPRRGEPGYHQLTGVIVKSSVVEVRQRVQMAVRGLEPARRRDLEMLGVRVDRIVDSVYVPSLDEVLRAVADARTCMSVHF
ncbi:hypothetical protein PoMZ_05125 [Pyricularia oryzae]|uniref:Uncharacterized protein n=1 Tax=Pyricularia oryzae TaxID=318829 RepID=A0A4P7NMK4_PYROR|nr:hypothetical protein PoMZ_05125 [Pyricularia oryzae]